METKNLEKSVEIDEASMQRAVQNLLIYYEKTIKENEKHEKDAE